ncbi:ribosomal protein S18-alanine N-acetyltransferase [Solimonas terrae]|uniref:[Ribosomal protein bS18]-alanine N-acetyltransferase n=1 Tax=Solimonas terrae TaxID=1396819 RepID=A0A6M2BN48_9GAMM|nr:ribosomal protein S18-alanine N-acetyltransferase [Solimonas terrae]NGY03651.1 ribosomal protein S18-alanine N-acetyltransferase [Solimonas terrae]
MSAQLQSAWRLYPMHPSHLQQVLAIEREAYTHPWTEGIFSDCLRVGYSAWVVTNTLGEVLAYTLMSMAVGEAHILNICVAPDQQRQGLAAFLLKHLLMVARAADVTLLLLEVRKSNKAAQKLYDGFGFARIGERRDYYPALDGREDALVLALELTGS